MAIGPKRDPVSPASPPSAGGSGPSVKANADADRRHALSRETDDAIFKLARLVGRQIAREQHEGEARGSSTPRRRKAP